jgi:hypothetical protein
VDLARRYVELRTYNERIRLEAVDNQTASAE